MRSMRKGCQVNTAVLPPSDLIDQAIAWHYGNPIVEQKQLLAGEACVNLSNRVVVKLTGVDRLTWLDSISSHQVANLADGESATTLILSPHGHVEHELKVIAQKDCCYLIAEVGSEEKLIEHLTKMRFMSRIEIEVVTDLAVIFDTNREHHPTYPTWLTPLEFADLGLTPAGSSAGGDQSRYLLPRPAKFAGREYLVPIAELDSQLATKQLAGSWAYNAIRIAAGVTRLAELDHKTLPHEIGLIGPGVHLSKGCYRGQETVARLHNLGKPPRRLTLLFLADGDAELPAKGDEVMIADTAVGVICGAAQHFEFGPIALALIKRSVDPAAALLVNGNAATQEVIINPEPNV